jgi:hypothetical protein
VTLTSPPCDSVKWLNQKERRSLAGYLDGCDREPGDELPVEEDRDDGAGGALMGPERFDLRFVRTLLRAEVFGAVQAVITAALRRRQTPESAISTALGALDGENYTGSMEGYADIRASVREAAYAALYALGTRGQFGAVTLLQRLEGDEAMAALVDLLRSGPEHDRSILQDALRAGIVPTAWAASAADRLQRAFRGELPVHDRLGMTIRKAKATSSKLKRDGFRRDQQADPAIQEAFETAAPALALLLGELDRLLTRLSTLPLQSAFLEDREAFTDVFGRIYEPKSAGPESRPIGPLPSSQPVGG